MTGTDEEKLTDVQPSPTAPQDDDVHGYSAEGIITGALVPPLPTTTSPLPDAGPHVTGWPDATPPVTDPATVAAWLAQKTVRPDQ